MKVCKLPEGLSEKTILSCTPHPAKLTKLKSKIISHIDHSFFKFQIWNNFLNLFLRVSWTNYLSGVHCQHMRGEASPSCFCNKPTCNKSSLKHEKQIKIMSTPKSLYRHSCDHVYIDINCLCSTPSVKARKHGYSYTSQVFASKT